MNSNKNNRTIHNKDRTKATAAVPVAGAMVTAAILLSGLSLIGIYQQPVLAQQQAMTESVGTTGAGGGTTGGGTVCILITSNGATTGNTTTTTDAAAQGGNAATAPAGGAGGQGNQPEVGGFDIQDAITAFQNNGTQSAMLTGEGGTTGAGGGTTGGGTVCILVTRGDTAGNTTTTTTDAAAQGENATTTTTAAAGGAREEGNGSLPQIRTHIQDAITAFQNSDAQGVMNSLDLADKALGGAGLVQDNNMTAVETAAGSVTNMTTTGGAP